jgi:RNA polymerase sigma-70 factor, ECF subfamily
MRFPGEGSGRPELKVAGSVRAATSTIAEVEAAPDWLLLQECAHGDRLAWRQLHRRYYPIASAFLRKLGVRDRDLEDTSQEVFLQMFRYLPRFRGEAQLKTWLYRLCITQARRNRRRLKLSETLRRLFSQLPEELVLAAPGFSEEAAKRRIEIVLCQLSEAERTVFVLYEMEGVPGKQIAEIVGCPETTVWRRLHYARRTFRGALSGSGGGA